MLLVLGCGFPPAAGMSFNLVRLALGLTTGVPKSDDIYGFFIVINTIDHLAQTINDDATISHRTIGKEGIHDAHIRVKHKHFDRTINLLLELLQTLDTKMPVDV